MSFTDVDPVAQALAVGDPVEVLAKADYAVQAATPDKLQAWLDQQPGKAAKDAPNEVKFAVVDGPVLAVPVGANHYTLRIDRSALADNGSEVIDCWSDISYDNGKTWQQLSFRFRALGGAITMPGADVLQFSSVFGPIAQPDNPNRLVQTHMIPLTGINTKAEVIFDQVVTK